MGDDFLEPVNTALASRVGNLCSNPECHALTSGPQEDPAKALNIGVAARPANGLWRNRIAQNWWTTTRRDSHFSRKISQTKETKWQTKTIPTKTTPKRSQSL
jgi:hypothetical protein